VVAGGGNAPFCSHGTRANTRKWASDSQLERGSGATTYYVKRYTSAGAETQIANAHIYELKHTDSGLTNRDEIFLLLVVTPPITRYRARAPIRAEVNATPTAPATPPAAPNGLEATTGKRAGSP